MGQGVDPSKARASGVVSGYAMFSMGQQSRVVGQPSKHDSFEHLYAF